MYNYSGGSWLGYFAPIQSIGSRPLTQLPTYAPIQTYNFHEQTNKTNARSDVESLS